MLLFYPGYIKNLCIKERDNLLVIHAHEFPSISVPYARKYSRTIELVLA